MSRGLQWVIGVSVGVIALAVVLAVVVPWVAGCFGFPLRAGMMTNGLPGRASGMMGRWANGTGTGGYGGMMGNGGSMMGGGYAMMPRSGARRLPASAERISIDQARTAAETYAASVGMGLAVTEVMEFENNFYALVTETDSGRGALELLIDPFTGAVGPEPGPNMMWNVRYGHMSIGGGGENRLSMDEARAFAQQALDAQLPGAKVHSDAASFYGYYTFDFDNADGSVAGMLSVEGSSGAVWMHTWHGAFLSEWEAGEMPA